MRHFRRYTALVLLATFLLMEVLLRIGGLASHVPEEVSLHGDRMFRPGLDAPYTAGGMGEIRGRYHINAQGWNSLADYESTDSAKIRIAIIGDSFIEGMQGDVAQSTGRILEGLLPGSQVHEYAKYGANICDHVRVFDEWVEGRYDYVFVWVTSDDLCGRLAEYMGRGADFRPPSALKRLYYSSAFLRYLGLNHRLGGRLVDRINSWLAVLHGQTDGRQARGGGTGTTGDRQASGTGTTGDRQARENGEDLAVNGDCKKSGWNRQAIGRLEGRVVFLYEGGRLDADFVRSHTCLEVEHSRQPYNFGFDGHWNLNGRTNCAASIRDYIMEL